MIQQGKKKGKQAEAAIAPSSFFAHSRMHLLIIAGCALALYLPTLSYQLTYYDDATLVDNISNFISGRHPFFEIFSQSVFGSSPGSGDFYYRPMLTLSLYINGLINGTSLTGFHFTNIVFHAGAACLLYVFFVKMKFSRPLSFAAAVLFAVHPALVQAVAWVPGRNDSLLTLLALASLIFLLQYFESAKKSRLALHLLFFLLSLLTKETAVLLPVLYFLTRKIYLNYQDVKNPPAGSKFPLAAFTTSWIVLAAVFFMLRRTVLGTTVGLPLNFTIENFIKNIPALLQYLGKMLLPFNLSTFPVQEDTTFIFGIATMAALLYFLFTSKNIRKDYLMFAGGWLLLFLLPAILRTSADYESVFLEHRIYFPLIGFLLLWMETDLIKNLHFEKALPKIILIGMVLIFSIFTFNHSKHYKDESSYWLDAVSTSPHASFAHRGLGTYYVTAGKPEDAQKEYETALQLNPDLKEVRNNLGRIYLNNGQIEKAEQFFNEELKINPNSAIAYYNLALLELDQKHIPEAETMIRKSLSLDPTYMDAQNDLCVILAMQKKYEEATQLCISILKREPSYESARKNLSLIFNAWEDSVKISYYRNVLKKMDIDI